MKEYYIDNKKVATECKSCGAFTLDTKNSLCIPCSLKAELLNLERYYDEYDAYKDAAIEYLRERE